MMILFNWLEQDGVKKVLQLIYSIINIIRIIIPIVLIVMITFDIAKKVINPEEKEGQKKIIIRIMAAIIIFFIPLFIKFIFKIADVDIDNLSSNNNNTSNIIETSKLTSFEITNCPNMSHRYNPDDTIILNTNIPKNYNGSIKWIPRVDHNVFKIISSSNESKVTLEVVEKPNHCITDISVIAGGIERNCVIVISKCEN